MSDLDAVLPTLATKADVAKLRAEIAWWIIWTATAVIGSWLAAMLVVVKLMTP